jgi:hypothetical protein
MVAYFEVKNGMQLKQIVRVEGVRGPAHARTILLRLRAAHADKARLLSLQEESLAYTAHEIENERNLLGRGRRYSTGTVTVTIPQSE